MGVVDGVLVEVVVSVDWVGGSEVAEGLREWERDCKSGTEEVAVVRVARWRR